MTDLEEALATLAICAAHHIEMVELAQAQGKETSDNVIIAGDALDVALVIAYIEGAKMLALKQASGLPVEYILNLTEGIL